MREEAITLLGRPFQGRKQKQEEKLTNYKGAFYAQGSDNKIKDPTTGAHFLYEEVYARLMEVQNDFAEPEDFTTALDEFEIQSKLLKKVESEEVQRKPVSHIKITMGKQLAALLNESTGYKRNLDCKQHYSTHQPVSNNKQKEGDSKAVGNVQHTLKTEASLLPRAKAGKNDPQLTYDKQTTGGSLQKNPFRNTVHLNYETQKIDRPAIKHNAWETTTLKKMEPKSSKAKLLSQIKGLLTHA